MVRVLAILTVWTLAPSRAEASACTDTDISNPLDCEGTGYITNILNLNVAPFSVLLDDYAGCPGGGFEQARVERIHEVTCDFDQVVTVRLRETQCDLDLFILDDTCDPSLGLACLGSNIEPWVAGADYTVEFFCEAGRTYYAVVEGWAVGRSAFEAQPECPLRSVPGFPVARGSGYRIIALCDEECTDGNDNDKDLFIDCSDSDCDDDPACLPPVEEDCDTPGDEDDDGSADCADADCSSSAACCDRDGDGVFDDVPVCGFGGDCDDDDEDVYPGAPEQVADDVDQDCDGVDDCWRDFDDDGFGSSQTVTGVDRTCTGDGESKNSGDCDDLVGSVFPGATELPGDNVDENCDGTVLCWRDQDGDQWGSGVTVLSGDTLCGNAAGEASFTGDCAPADPTRHPEATELPGDEIDQDCDAKELCFADTDHDGFGSTDTVVSNDLTCRALGESRVSTDCRDDRDDVYPGATEVPYDGIDQDCVGGDWTDVDGDGVPGGSGGSDCNDNDSAIKPGAVEIVADGIDQNCDGMERCRPDADGDGRGDGSATPVLSADLTCSTAGVSTTNDDCNDADPEVFPGATELPGDNFDQNCDGTELCWRDGDGDGWGGTATVSSADEVCGNAVPESGRTGDCADSNGAIFPTAPEGVADGVDQDCDGTELCYRDADADGFGALPSVVSANTSCADAGEADDNTDCNDASASVRPGGVEVPYDGIDQDCAAGDLVDVDGDGANGGPSGTDCADGRASVRPGATEVANGIDDDCDGVVDDGTTWRDDDGDGYSEAGGDCDDARSTVYPGAPELLPTVDDDCDGLVDEGTSTYDDDGDGFSEAQGDCRDGDASVWPGAPESPGSSVDRNCDGALSGSDNDDDGYASIADCNDADPLIFPGAPERPNGLDDDCDNTTDEGTGRYDNDGDGVTAFDGDCNDADPLMGPSATERPNGRDDDCDGLVDEATRFFDDDGDGWTEIAGDCDDASVVVRPDADEAVNGFDDDCDGVVDEGAGDGDGDGWTITDGDCDDGDGFVNPETPELCFDGIDNDCDDKVDEGCVVEAPLPPDDETGSCAVVGGVPAAWMLAVAAGLVRRRRR